MHTTLCFLEFRFYIKSKKKKIKWPNKKKEKKAKIEKSAFYGV
jgi:hypothetical protein